MRLGRTLIIAFLAVSVLGAGYYFALKYEPKKDNAETSVNDTITVFETDVSSVSKISVTNPDDSFTLIKKDNGWGVLDKDYITLTSAVDAYVYYFSKITASSVIEENAKDLSVYGLSQPQAEITVVSDKEKSFAVGSADPTGNYYYFAEKNSGKVYTVYRATADAYFRKLSSLRDMTVTNIEVNSVRGIDIKSDKGLLSVVYSPLEEGKTNEYGVISVWDIVSPVKVKAQNQKLTDNILTPACSITASDIVEDKPTDLSKYGFNKEVTLKLEDGTNVRFKIGRANGVNYIYPENAVSVYSVSADSVAFADLRAEDIMQTFVAIYNIEDVESVKYESNKISCTMSKKGDSYFSGETMASKDAYTAAYQSVIGLMVDGIADKGYDKSVCAGKLQYKLAGGETVDIYFYGYDDLNYAVVRDGRAAFFIKKTKLDEMEKKLQSFKDNPHRKS